MNELIIDRIQKLNDQIAKFTAIVGAKSDEIHIVAISKKQPEYKIIEAQNAGIKYFGENKVQDFVEKYKNTEIKSEWHFVGHLQTNKVKYIYDKISLIHSVDSVRLAEKISQLCADNNKMTNILLQVNTSGEESKFGFSLEEIFEKVDQILKMSNLNIQGLMTMAPFTNETNRISASFSRLRDLSEELEKQSCTNMCMKYLSMGMSNDYEIAIKEGSNMLRIGTLIFGPRN